MGARMGIALAAVLVAGIAASPASGEPGQFYIADRAGFTVYGSDLFDGTIRPIEGGSFGDLRNVTVAPDGALFIADSGGSQPGPFRDAVFRKVLPGGPLQAFVSGPPLINPTAVEFDHAGRLLVADEDAAATLGRGLVARYDLATGSRTIVAGGPPFRNPVGVVAAPTGEIFVADEAPAGGVSGAVFRIAPNGQVNAVKSGPPLGSPVGIAREPDGSLLVADPEAGAVFRLNPATGALATVWSGPPLSEPTGIAVLPDRSLLVTDTDGPSDLGALWSIPPGSSPLAIMAGQESVLTRPVAVTVDPPQCREIRATIVGTTGPDILAGSPGPDVIAGLGGRDRIPAGGGNDIVCGGDGKDLLKGQGGKDLLLGEVGRDRLVGGKGGKDRCLGGAGRDLSRTCERGK
jgi:RTX calcium-binding nonapeptide repeat (4 copies)